MPHEANPATLRDHAMISRTLTRTPLQHNSASRVSNIGDQTHEAAAQSRMRNQASKISASAVKGLGQRVMGGDYVYFHSMELDSVLVVHGEGREAELYLLPLSGKQTDPGAKGIFMLQRSKVAGGGEQFGRLAEDEILMWHCASGMYLTWGGDGAALQASKHYLGEDGGAGASAVLLQTIDRTSGVASSKPGVLTYGEKLWLSNSCWTGARLYLSRGDNTVSRGGVELVPTKGVRVPLVGDAFEIRRADSWLARSVIRARRFAASLQSIAGSFAACEKFYCESFLFSLSPTPSTTLSILSSLSLSPSLFIPLFPTSLSSLRVKGEALQVAICFTSKYCFSSLIFPRVFCFHMSSLP